MSYNNADSGKFARNILRHCFVFFGCIKCRMFIVKTVNHCLNCGINIKASVIYCVAYNREKQLLIGNSVVIIIGNRVCICLNHVFLHVVGIGFNLFHRIFCRLRHRRLFLRKYRRRAQRHRRCRQQCKQSVFKFISHFGTLLSTSAIQFLHFFRGVYSEQSEHISYHNARAFNKQQPCVHKLFFLVTHAARIVK